MASRKTLLKTMAVTSRLTRILGLLAEAPLPVAFDMRTGKIITKWEGTGELVERRKKGPGLFELIYRELPQQMRREFIVPSPRGTPTVEPTKEELREFERYFLTTARRVIHREITKRLDHLPDPTKKERGRPRRKKEKVALVQQTIEKWLHSGECKTKTEAVKKAAVVFGEGGRQLHTDTIWRYLRLSHTSRARLRAATPSPR